MNTYIVVIRTKEALIADEFEALYSIDAINLAVDKWLDDVINEKGDFSITCKIKGD